MAAFSGSTVGTQASHTANATIDRFIPARTLEVQRYNVQLYPLARKQPIPPGESQTVSFSRWPHFGLPLTPLPEADSGSATAMSTERVTCVTEPWGGWVAVSSLAQYITRGSPIDIAAERLGVQSARTIDREITRQLLGGTQVYFPGTVTDRSGLTATSYITTTLMRKVRARMKRAGAHFYEGNRHVLVAGPEVCADIQADTTFLDAATYQKWDILVSGEVGAWQGFRIVESNTIPYIDYSATAITLGATTVVADAALPDDTYYVIVSGNDANGFETLFYAGANQATSASNVILTVATPSTSGISSYNIYVGLASDYSDCSLVKERAAAGTTYRVSTDGNNALGIELTTTGRIVGVAPSSGVTVHPVFFFGSEYFVCTEIKKIQTYRTSGAQKTDPLDRYSTVGWKIEGFKACITDHNEGGRMEVATAN